MADDLRRNVPCVFFKKGSCRNGDKCPFSHELNQTDAPSTSLPSPTKAQAPRSIVLDLKPGECCWLICVIVALCAFYRIAVSTSSSSHKTQQTRPLG